MDHSASQPYATTKQWQSKWFIAALCKEYDVFCLYAHNAYLKFRLFSLCIMLVKRMWHDWNLLWISSSGIEVWHFVLFERVKDAVVPTGGNLLRLPRKARNNPMSQRVLETKLRPAGFFTIGGSPCILGLSWIKWKIWLLLFRSLKSGVLHGLENYEVFRWIHVSLEHQSEVVIRRSQSHNVA